MYDFREKRNIARHDKHIPGGSDSKASAYNVGDLGSIPELGRSSGKGNNNPLQYSCLENPMDRGALWATVHGVPKSLEIGFCGFKRKEFKILKPQNTWIYSGIISICIK